MSEALIPTLREYRTGYGLTADRTARLSKDALIMHPGPMNRGVEIDAEAAGDERSVITGQVANGVAVRMAVLFLLLGGGTGALEVADQPDEALSAVQQPEAARA